MSIGNNIKELRQRYHLTQAELGEIAGVSDKAVSSWENGNAEPRMGALERMAQHFGITKVELIAEDSTPRTPPNRIKVYGKVPAGIPLEAVEDIIDWEDIPEEWLRGDKEYFGLMVEGYSMYPTYQPGDTIICLRQPDCESGQDAVVYVNGYNATLKRVIKQQFGILLQPLNPDPQYEAHFYDYDDPDNPISILGVVVELRRKMNR